MVKHSQLTYGDDICGDEIPAVEEHGEDDEVATHPRHTKETGLQQQQLCKSGHTDQTHHI